MTSFHTQRSQQSNRKDHLMIRIKYTTKYEKNEKHIRVVNSF